MAYAHHPSDIGALVGAFGDAYATAHSRNMEQQLAQKQALDQGVVAQINKHLWDNPELANDPDFVKFYASKVGKDNANGMIGMVQAFAASPAGVLKKAFGAADLTRPDVPPEGPVFNPGAPDAQPQAIQAVVAPRFAAQSPVETGAGLGTGMGQLQYDTQQLGAKDTVTPAQQSTIDLNAAKTQNMQDRTKVAQERLAFDKSKPVKAGPPTPEQKVAAKLAMQDVTPIDDKTQPLYVLPNGKAPALGTTHGEAAKQGAIVLTPEAAKVRNNLTASAHLVGRMENAVNELYPDNSAAGAAGRAAKYGVQYKAGYNPTLQDLEQVNNIGLHLLRNVLNEKGNIRGEVLANGEKNLLGLYETRTSARSKLRFWKDVFAAGYQATGAPPPHQVRKYLVGASKNLEPLFEPGTFQGGHPARTAPASVVAAPEAPAAPTPESDVESFNKVMGR